MPFELDATTPGYYLLHRSTLGQFELSSDAVMASYIEARNRRIDALVNQAT